MAADINECMINEQACSGQNEICNNTEGSFQCDCQPGYIIINEECGRGKFKTSFV